MILAAVAGEDLVVAVAVDVGDPEGMAVGQGVVDHRPRAEPKLAVVDRLARQTTTSLPCQGSIVARKRRPSARRPRWTSLDAALRRLAGCAAAGQRAARASLERRLPTRKRSTPCVGGREDVGDAIAVGVDHLDGVDHGAALDDVAVHRSRSGLPAVRKTWSRAGLVYSGGRASRPKIGATTRSSRLSPSTSPSAGGGCWAHRRSAPASRDRPGRRPVARAAACRSSACSWRTHRRWRSRPCRRRRGRPSRSR